MLAAIAKLGPPHDMSIRVIFQVGLLLPAIFLSGQVANGATTNSYTFNYPNRSALLADGWSFSARTPTGLARNTESPATSSPPAISYNQSLHPGVIRLPVAAGSNWGTANNTTNHLFRTLSSNWVSFQIQLAVKPTQNYEQVNLSLYQDDDNYLDVGHGFNSSEGGEAIMLVLENGGVQLSSPRHVKSTAVSLTNVYLRLERNLTNNFVAAWYSTNGLNWSLVGEVSQEFTNTRVGIMAGGLSTASPINCSVSQMEIVTSDTPLKPLLVSSPAQLVFQAVAGESCNQTQQLRLIERRSLTSLNWKLTANTPWVRISTTNGVTAGTSLISVNAAGLPVGVHTAILTCEGTNAFSATTEVKLIINPATRVRPTTWREGRKGAMSVSVDDSNNTGYFKLQAQGYKGTYYLWGRSSYSTPFTSYRNSGMELGTHTVDHPCNTINEPTRRYQLEANISGVVSGTGASAAEVLSFAWPCGQTTIRDQVIAEDYFLSSRGYNFNALEETTPQNWMNLKSYNSHEHNPSEFNPNAPPNPADLKTIVDAAINQGKWFNLVLHGLENDDSAISYSAGKDLWVAPVGAVIKYIQQRDRIVFTNYLETATNISFNFSRLPLMTTRFRSFESTTASNSPVTLQVDISGIPAMGALTVDGLATTYQLRTNQSGQRFVIFNANATTNLSSASLVVSNPVPIVSSQDITLHEDTVTNLVLSGFGLPGHVMDFAIITTPTNGALSGLPPNLSYTPGTNYFGADWFSFRVTDLNNGLSATGLVRLMVQPVNDAPLIVNPLANQAVAYNAPVSLIVTNVFADSEGNIFNLSATGLPPGLQCNNGLISGIPTLAGNYPVALIATDTGIPPKAATNDFVLSVTPSNAVVTLLNLVQTYDGSARMVLAQTDPPGLTVGFTYNGGDSAPTNAGNYVVVGTVAAANFQGAVTNSLVVLKSNTVVLLSKLHHYFDGTPRAAEASTQPPGLTVGLTYNGSTTIPVAAGNYEVVGTIADLNYAGVATNRLQLSEVPLRILAVERIDQTNVMVTWQSVPNFNYTLQFKNSMDHAAWLDLAAILSGGNTTTVTNAFDASYPQRFYRVRFTP